MGLQTALTTTQCLLRKCYSFISYRLAILHDTARVALEAGNSPDIIFGHYRELVTPEAAQAWFNIMPAKK